MHSVVSRFRRTEDDTTLLRSGLLNLNGGVQKSEHATRQHQHSRHRWRQPLLLWLLTLALWLPGLGDLPLRDWDEGRIATVARSTETLLPMKWDHAYLNKPPGIHWPMGRMIHLFGEEEASVRFLPALLSSFAVPLVVLVRRTLSRDAGVRGDQVACLAGLVLMTLLPMARHGRLAMLDGTLVSCSLLLWWGWLGARTGHGALCGRSGRERAAAQAAGPARLLLIAAVVGGINGLPQGRRCLALGIGLLPGVGWHLWHFSQRGQEALVMWGGQGLARVTSSVGDGHGWWTPWAELLEGGWPWLLLLPAGLTWAWRHRREPAGRWELGLLLGSAVLVLPLRTQLPWYSHLLWPPIALLCAEALHDLIERGTPRWVPQIWQGLGFGVLVAGIIGAGWFSLNLPGVSLLLAGLGLLLGGALLTREQRSRRWQGCWSCCRRSLALLALWQSQLWLWELNEAWDPRPVAAEIRRLPPSDAVFLKGPTRPSLGWYAGRELERYRKGDAPEHPFWLISDRPMEGCSMADRAVEGRWQLWRCG